MVIEDNIFAQVRKNILPVHLLELFSEWMVDETLAGQMWDSRMALENDAVNPRWTASWQEIALVAQEMM